MAQIPLTKNVVTLKPIVNGIIEGTSGATDEAGNALTFKLEPKYQQQYYNQYGTQGGL